MTAQQYRIVTQGVCIDGFDTVTVRDRLAAMFKLTGEQAERMLSGRRIVLKRHLDRVAAERITEGLARAGLVCEILPETGQSDKKTTEPPSTDPETASSAVLIPAKTHPSILFTPQNCPSLTEQQGMLVTGRPDTAPILYRDLACAMIWTENSPNGQGFRLVLFVSTRRRPFEVADTAIDFRSLGGAASTAREGLRLLVRFLMNRNPGLRIDEPTARFLDGGQPRVDETCPLAHITAVGMALIEQGAIRGD